MRQASPKKFRYLADPLCLLAWAAYALNRLWFKPSIPSEMLHSWFNDFWMIPAALPPVLWLQKICNVRTGNGMPTTWEIVWHLAVWTVICEWIGPAILPGHTGDWKDVIAYSLGAFFSAVWWRRNAFFASKKRTPSAD